MTGWEYVLLASRLGITPVEADRLPAWFARRLLTHG